MNDKDIIKTINDILWWIPNKKLRDFIKELINIILKIKEQNNILLNRNINVKVKYIVIPIRAGFVDQLYSYVLGCSLESFYDKKVLYDISWYNNYGKDAIGKYNRNFELLNIFNDFSFKYAANNEILIAKQFLIDGSNYKDMNIINLFRNIQSEIIYLENGFGFDMIRLSFEEVFDLDRYILPKLDNDNKSVYDDIKNCKHSVACHIRRNDYLVVSHRLYDRLDENYFIKAIEKINKKVKEKLKIYFFSDDIDWVKNKLIPLIKNKYDYMAVDINDNDRGYFDFYLISNCKYQIASEGRFCETAHILNKYQNKILITPKDIDKKY